MPPESDVIRDFVPHFKSFDKDLERYEDRLVEMAGVGAIVETGLDDGRPFGERIEDITERLAGFEPAAIKAFHELPQVGMAESYRSDVWALGYLLRDGCSDDAFRIFRAWLVLQGREVFAATLREPEAFDVARLAGTADGVEYPLEVAAIAYDARSGTPMPRPARKSLTIGGPPLAEADFAAALPHVAEKPNRSWT